jgi:hypothetical protein
VDKRLQKNGSVAGRKAAARGKSVRGVMRPIPIYSQFPSDLPIAREEIQMVLAALGPDLAALFSEDG